MKRSTHRLRNLTLIPTALAATLAIATTAITAANAEVRTPLSGAVTVNGSSGQVQSQCGFHSGSPAEVIVVDQPTPLLFRVQSQGQPTLWITGPVDRCVLADGSSGGNIEVPGVWQPGTYSVYVGNQAQGGQSFTLSIIPQ